MATRAFYLTTLMLVAAVLVLSCGNDTVAPEDPSLSSVIPDIVFFNTADPQAVVLFEGRANDNRWVDSVLISFDNGAVWRTADIDSSSPNTVRSVAWSYPAVATDMPSVLNTVLVKVTDQDANETVSSPQVVEKQEGATTGSLLAVFSGAAPGDVIALSSGAGGAYGGPASSLTIPVNTAVTVVGAGYGDTTTSGGLAPAVATTATVIEASLSTSRIFSVQADLDLKGLRLIGAAVGVHIAGTTGSSDPAVKVEECLFDGQDAWAVMAADDDSGLAFSFLSSIVDASSAGSVSRGGLYLEEVSYTVSGSKFYWQTDPLGPADTAEEGAGVQAVGGTGTITDSLFDENGLAIWASGGSPLITSCSISGAAFTTYGINLTGSSDTGIIRRNTITDNLGYGLRIGGNMIPKIRRNVISANKLSGIYIDFTGPDADAALIDIGKTGDLGYNDLFGNTHPDVAPQPNTVEVYVSSATGNYNILIPAVGNYWGVNVAGLVPSRIYDGVDTGDRARINHNNPWLFPQN